MGIGRRTSLFFMLFAVIFFVSSNLFASTRDAYTVLVYMVGSDLESDEGEATGDLREMMRAGSSPDCNVLVQTGGAIYWHHRAIKKGSIGRWYVAKGQLQNKGTLPLADMCDAYTLSSFIEWGVKNYPAERYIVIFWNHGAGAIGGFGHDEHYDSSLSISDIARAFEDVRTRVPAFSGCEVIGFDACLMATLETALALQDAGAYLVASEETEPGHGWDYTAFLSALYRDAALEGDDIGIIIADAYKAHAEQKETENQITLSVVDLSEVADVANALGSIAKPLAGMIVDETRSGSADTFRVIANARAQAEDYGNDVSEQSYTDLVDIGDLMNALYRKTEYAGCLAVSSALDDAIIYNVNSVSTKRAQGLSLYFPYKDTENIDENLSTYQTLFMPDTYKTFITAYATARANDTTPIAFAEGEPTIVDRDVYGDGEGDVYRVRFAEGASDLAELYSILVSYDMEEDIVYFLGMDSDVRVEGDDVYYEWTESWVTLDGALVSLYHESEDEDIIEYAIPVVLREKEVDIIVVVDKETYEYEILGASEGIDEETGKAAKAFYPLTRGDVLTPLFYYLNVETDEEGFAEGTPFTYQGGDLAYETLDPGTYFFGFYAIDYAQNDSASDFAVVTVE